MIWMRRWRKRLRALLHRGVVERELDEELAYHLELDTEKNVRAGMSRAEARRKAAIAFGGMEKHKEEVRETRHRGYSTHTPSNYVRIVRILYTIVVSALLAAPLSAQEPVSDPEPAPARSGSGSEFLIPLGSLIVPGLGQYLNGASLHGVAYTGVALGGYLLSSVGDDTGETLDGPPHRAEDQLAQQAAHTALTSGFLSAWDSFHRAVPMKQTRGEYGFLGERETVGDLLTAPFDHRFLGRWTTWVDLAATAGVLAFALSGNDPKGPYHPFGVNDGAYVVSLSMNAGVGEEALFRGWLLPMLYQNLGGRFWLANGLQATMFGALHPRASWFAMFITASAAWEGWLVRRNDWSIRESVFHHFWYDVAIVTAALLTDERGTEVRITFPVISF